MITHVESPHGEVRFGMARRWLRAQDPARPLLIVAHTLDAGNALARAAAQDHGCVFGWSVESFASLAVRRSTLALAQQQLTLAPRLALEAVCVRVVSELVTKGKLGRLMRIADRPGLPRALLRTFTEVGMADVPPERLPSDLAQAYACYRRTLEEFRLADRPRMFQVLLEAGPRPTGDALCVYDVAAETKLERLYLQAFTKRAERVFLSRPQADGANAPGPVAFGSAPTEPEPLAATAEFFEVPLSLHRLQARLFSNADALGEPDESVSILSAPGESRESVEIVRRVLAEAERGVPFDRMAILLRSPFHYRTHLVEALRRAGIPAHFSKGTVQPELSGRALLVLLDCAAEGLSATRFAEYLSLGVVPGLDARTTHARSVPIALIDEESAALLRATDAAADDREAATQSADPPPGELLVPRRWEALLVDAAVLGGAERWRKRLATLAREIEHDAAHATEEQAEGAERRLESLQQLSDFALPIIDLLAELPVHASWGEWIDALSTLAERAIHSPLPVLAALSELRIMCEVGPVDLSEVRAVLKGRLGDVVLPPAAARGGEILVASVDEARGRVFETVFIPGLAEKLFPQRVVEDPLLGDADRALVSEELEVQAHRVAHERMALAIAVGAARSKVVLSYPRFENDKARPRVPSFYALEALRAAEGRLPGFAELARRADAASRTRMGWPAPRTPADAIDASEYDLSVLHQFLNGEARQSDGAARYLIGENARLARALQFRARRWRKEWRNVDGLVDPSDRARSALATRREALMRRGFAVTSLERYSQCPYRFYLSTVVGLRARRTTPSVEELDPALRGSLIHEMLRAIGVALRERGLLGADSDPSAAECVLDSVVREVADSRREDLAPAIERVWQDAIDEIHADLRPWLRELLAGDWEPLHFELPFGLASGSAEIPSRQGPIVLPFGLPLRGAIDLVEQRRGTLRATDYKTGTAPAAGAVVGGGTRLQPTFYALVLEQLFPDMPVEGGNLYYCSARGEFRRHEVPLNERTRSAAAEVAAAIVRAFDEGFFPAAPAKEACQNCEFQSGCGPYEAERLQIKDRSRLEGLTQLRRML